MINWLSTTWAEIQLWRAKRAIASLQARIDAIKAKKAQEMAKNALGNTFTITSTDTNLRTTQEQTITLEN